MTNFYNFTSMFFYPMLRFYGWIAEFYNLMLEFNENVIKFYDDLIPVIVEWGTLIPQLISLLNNNKSQDGSDNDLPDDPDDPDGPGPGPGPDGDDSEPEDNDSKNKKLDKGKGKAKETTPELTPEELEKLSREFEEKTFQNDLEKARLESLRVNKIGESSKDGATLQQREDDQARLNSLQQREDDQARLDSLQREDDQARLDSLKRHEQDESSKERASLEQSNLTETQEEDSSELSPERYRRISGIRRDMAKEFNDIAIKLNSDEIILSQEQRANLLSKSLYLRSEVAQFDNYLQYLREVLNIQPEDEYNPPDSSEESSSEDSSSEESRPSKRPKR